MQTVLVRNGGIPGWVWRVFPRTTLERALLIAHLAVLNILDVLTTHTVLANGGQEINPIGEWLIRNGVLGPAKAAVVLAVALCALRSRSVIGDRALKVVVLVYAVVIANNLVHLLRVPGF